MTHNVTAETVKTFYTSINNMALVVVVLTAREHAVEMRAKVDAYTLPILAAMDLRDDEGQQILKPSDLYLCSTDAAEFYAACDRAHKEHGFDLEPDYCPALIAESEVVRAENALLKIACAHYGLPYIYDLSLRSQMLNLLTNPPTK